MMCRFVVRRRPEGYTTAPGSRAANLQLSRVAAFGAKDEPEPLQSPLLQVGFGRGRERGAVLTDVLF